MFFRIIRKCNLKPITQKNHISVLLLSSRNHRGRSSRSRYGSTVHLVDINPGNRLLKNSLIARRAVYSSKVLRKIKLALDSDSYVSISAYYSTMMALGVFL